MSMEHVPRRAAGLVAATRQGQSLIYAAQLARLRELVAVLA
jgi:hypothetical protein